MHDRTISSEIWKESHRLMNERAKKMQELMKQYDTEVYYPALKQLTERCEQNGHDGGNGKFESNGFGWIWQRCNQCGGRYNIEGPNSEQDFSDEVG